jgi:predicted lipid carrier protein YhbT
MKLIVQNADKQLQELKEGEIVRISVKDLNLFHVSYKNDKIEVYLPAGSDCEILEVEKNG